MERKVPERPDLLSWKEVAHYLGCSVRTAQKWEKEKALPVHRMPGTAGQVMAKSAEIDHWKEDVQKHRPWWLRTDFRAYYAIALPVLLLMLAAHDVYFHHWNLKEPPAAYRTDQNELVILDKSGRELWRKFFETPIWGRGETPLKIERADTVKLVDLHGNGTPEVLFVRAAFGFGKDVLYAFSPAGEELWKFEAPNQRSSDFLSAITSIAVSPSTSSRHVFVLSCRSPAHLSTLHVIDSAGNANEVFEHEGHLDVMELADIDRDGAIEIVIGGTSSKTRQANLHLVDPTLGLQAELLFPRSGLNLKLGDSNRVARIGAEPGHIRVGVEEWFDNSSNQVCYLLDEKLNLQAATACGGLDQVWMRLNEERHLNLPSLQDELMRLREQIQVLR
jgi:excisionase family DNA binding protein